MRSVISPVTALYLYLLFRAMASSQPWDVTRDACVWGWALGHHTDSTYGISADALDRGQRELGDLELLSHRVTEVENWLNPTGKTTNHTFELKAPFTRPLRRTRHLSMAGK